MAIPTRREGYEQFISSQTKTVAGKEPNVYKDRCQGIIREQSKSMTFVEEEQTSVTLEVNFSLETKNPSVQKIIINGIPKHEKHRILQIEVNGRESAGEKGPNVKI